MISCLLIADADLGHRGVSFEHLSMHLKINFNQLPMQFYATETEVQHLVI